MIMKQNNFSIACRYAREWQSNEGAILAHYTTFEAAVKILSSKRLRFGRLSGMNDINESYRAIWYPHDTTDPDRYKSAIYAYRQISLTLDKNQQRCFNIHPMWGHYAQKGAGVCIVLDKHIIEQRAKTMKCRYGNVSYRKSSDSTVVFDAKNPETDIAKHYRAIFYRKSKAWGYEQEYRIIKKCGEGNEDVFLDISEAIKAIILCNGDAKDLSQRVFCTPMFCFLRNLFGDKSPIFAYEHFGGDELLVCQKIHTVWTNGPLASGQYVIDV